MPTGKECVLHVEGDTRPILTLGDSLEDFLKRNHGSYLVVTGRLDE